MQCKYALEDLIVEMFQGRISPSISFVTWVILSFSSTHTEISGHKEISDLPKLYSPLCSAYQYTKIAIKKKDGNNYTNTPLIPKIVFYCTLESRSTLKVQIDDYRET